MPLSEIESKEALRAANDWLVLSDLPGSEAAREGIATVIPLVMMGEVAPHDLDALASLVEEHGRSMRGPNVPVEMHGAQLAHAVEAAFAYVKSLSAP